MTRDQLAQKILVRLDDIDAQLKSDPPVLEPDDAYDILTRLERIESELFRIERFGIAAVLATWGLICVAMIVVGHFAR